MTRPVICSACGQHVFDIDITAKPGAVRRASHLTPAHPDVQQPSPGGEVICPLCGSRDFAADIDDTVTGRRP